MSKKNSTLKDVAKVAGVSTATVARVIHGNGYIAEETRRQVEGALRKTGYRINVVAQGLRTQRTLSIGHILHSITPNPFYAGVALGAEQEAFKHGWSVLTINMQGSAERERRAVETLIQRRVDAILFTTAVDEANVRLALDADLLVVQIHRPTSIATHTVIVDNYVGSVSAMEHLIELGHSRIGFIGADPKCPLSDLSFRDHPGRVERERLAAYLDTLQKHHIPVEDGLIALGRYYSLHDHNVTNDGYNSMKQFLQMPGIPTAVFATCDILAAGVLQAVYERSLRVPTDISVIGFDDTYAPYLTPPLTTVELPMTEIGKAAVRIVLEHSKQQDAASIHYQARLSSRLVLRASTGRVSTTQRVTVTEQLTKEGFMRQIKQALAWGGFARGEMTGEQLIRVAADIGYAGIEMPPQEYWQQIKDHGLTIPTIAGHQSIVEGLNRHENHPRIEKEIRAHLGLAEQWGIEYLIVFSGNRAGLDDNVGAEITAEGLRRVATVAEEADVTLILELLNSKRNHKDYQADHVAWGIQVCQAVDSSAVRLLYDIYHMQIMEGDIIHTIRTHHPYFAHYHTAGNPGRHEIDETQELQYAPIVRAIVESGYSGYIGHEFSPTGDPIAALKYAFALCNGI